MYRVRLKFQLETSRTLAGGDTPRFFDGLQDAGPWELKRVTERSLGHGESWALRSSPVATADEAARAGLVAQSALMILALSRGFGINFTARAPSGFMFDAGLRMLAGPGETLLRDYLGLHIYEDNGPVRFVTVNPVGLSVSSPVDGLMAQWAEHAASARVADPRTLLGFELYSSSRSENSARARLLLVFMAVEALLEPAQRSEPERMLIADFLAKVSDAPIPEHARERLRSALSRLTTESIAATGTAMMERVGGSAAVVAFREAYQLRNRLVHGGGAIEISELTGAAGRLEPFVRDAILSRLRPRLANRGFC